MKLCSHNHEHQVNETRKRSLVKAVTFRILEVVIDVFIILACMRSGFPELVVAGVGAISVEASCGIGYYFWERLWNKISWGREVKDVVKNC